MQQMAKATMDDQKAWQDWLARIQMNKQPLQQMPPPQMASPWGQQMTNAWAQNQMTAMQPQQLF